MEISPTHKLIVLQGIKISCRNLIREHCCEIWLKIIHLSQRCFNEMFTDGRIYSSKHDGTMPQQQPHWPVGSGALTI